MATDVLMATDSGARKKMEAGHGGPWLAKVLGHQFYQLGARVEVNVGANKNVAGHGGPWPHKSSHLFDGNV